MSNFQSNYEIQCITTIGVWEGVAMDSLKYRQGPPCPTPLRSAGGPPLTWLFSHLQGAAYAWRAACSMLLSFCTLHGVRL